MKPLFADAYYWFAIANPRDAGHARAMKYTTSPVPILTTAWVITELADGLCRATKRAKFVGLLQMIHSDPFHTVIPADQSLMDRGLALYSARPDKDWSLTDCISFVVMEERKLTDALTADQHFIQAGFNALLV